MRRISKRNAGRRDFIIRLAERILTAKTYQQRKSTVWLSHTVLSDNSFTKCALRLYAYANSVAKRCKIAATCARVA